ncbi:hypothetical protein ACFLTH_01460 [Bacteroidota bacterium]
MKKISSLFFTLLLVLIVNQNLYSQNYQIILTLMEPLPEVDFAAFALTNNLSGAPRIMSIEILTPTRNEQVILEGKIEWQKDDGDAFIQLFWFRTQRFFARNISNTDIGTNIRIAENTVNSNLTQDNISKGRPTGTYRLTVILRDANGALKSSDQKEISFLNPTQTLSITTPEMGSTQDIGNVQAAWDAVVGASHYGIKANVRTRSSQSLEEALNSGNPLVDKDNIGINNIVSLREHLRREWFAGQEIVLQVTAFIAGVRGGTTLHSNIVNFFVGSTTQLNTQLITLLELLSDLSGRDLVQRYKDGKLDLSNMRVSLDDGRILSQVELNEILNYLKINPDKIINVRFTNK